MDFGKRLTSGPETRIAIVGTDSSRPSRLLDFLTGPEAPRRCRVTHIVALDGDDPAPLAKRYAIAATGRDVSGILGSVDAALLCARDGRAHAAQALPLLEAGISVWVDKPLATREDDARAMVRAATARGLVLTCRSGFRAADAISPTVRWLREAADPAAFEIAGPAERESPYGGLAHYGIHHVEIFCEVARRAGRGHPRAVTDVVPDEDGVRATVLGDDMAVELAFHPPTRCTGFTITAGDHRWPVEAPARYLEDQVRDFLADVRHGRGTQDPEALVTPVRLLEQVLEFR
ncbi:Gfo/Idh/MocA family oxidoreductase [Amycolatopsis aidingensis]|uniref:Gfo/Idh/MocA family oxidoreductase n=1 Tax=Amycolatopsis aidingensis TaxID=2842453 RepID=UPI001E53FDEF|nr:Gfo/Idh/MocA family oxidoreductase [Amycolatopsis aidingensis]